MNLANQVSQAQGRLFPTQLGGCWTRNVSIPELRNNTVTNTRLYALHHPVGVKWRSAAMSLGLFSPEDPLGVHFTHRSQLQVENRDGSFIEIHQIKLIMGSLEILG